MVRLKLSFEQVKAKFEKRGYELLETEYENDMQRMHFKCPHHPDQETRISYASLRRGCGCVYCGRERTGKVTSERNKLPREEELKFPKRKYSREEREVARNESIKLLDTHCWDCPFNNLNKLEDVEGRCYRHCPYGLELRKCGAIMAGEDVDAVTEHYRKEALVNE
ncbi:hypothetical protein [Bacillus gaemokensis]|uniref:hypothetical protein n=1 Tax=Bacillus gaemokensis TaxID=574375 RepID=UPI0005355DD1|nr:hypothetical protein [Bacillus gaemokensis]KYG28789.1 hypothetical protein AZF08_13775 [Bacillus gaemokensis]